LNINLSPGTTKIRRRFEGKSRLVIDRRSDENDKKNNFIRHNTTKDQHLNYKEME